MAKEAKRLEEEFIATAQEKTGHSLDAWMDIIRVTGLDKPNAILTWLKSKHGLNHMQAQILSGIYLNSGKPVFDYPVMFARLFEGKNSQKPIYEAVEALIRENMPGVELIPTKSYVSLEADRVFGCVKINTKNVRIGFDLGDRPFDDRVQQAKGLGAMPNISHMVEVTSVDEINGDVLGHLQAAYQRTHSG